MKCLVAGWFSFEQMGHRPAISCRATSCATGCATQAGLYDVARSRAVHRGVDWRCAEPMKYSDVAFGCGPFGNGDPLISVLDHFKGRRLTGVNLSMLDPLDAWNPFDLLLERDSSAGSKPDLTFLSSAPRVPVVGVILIDNQTEYGKRDRLREANEAIHRLAASRPMAAVPIDTRLDDNKAGLRTPEEVESLIVRMDLVLTTRLHGTVLAIKNGVPAIAVDPVAGGAKIHRQCETIGWPMVLRSNLTGAAAGISLRVLFDREARAKARACAERAAGKLKAARDRFLAFMVGG